LRRESQPRRGDARRPRRLPDPLRRLTAGRRRL
jgi:hypothetical protein